MLRERKKRQTRAAIIASAITLFHTQGFSYTSIEEIATAAVSRGTFFNYFRHKEAVIVAFGRDQMVTLTARVEEQLRENVSAERIIHHLWRMVAALRAEHGEAIVILAQELLHPAGERAAQAATAFPLGALVAAAGQRAGQVRADLDAERFGTLVADLMLVGAATQQRTADREAAEASLRQSLAIIFHGVLVAGTPSVRRGKRLGGLQGYWGRLAKGRILHTTGASAKFYATMRPTADER